MMLMIQPSFLLDPLPNYVDLLSQERVDLGIPLEDEGVRENFLMALNERPSRVTKLLWPNDGESPEQHTYAEHFGVFARVFFFDFKPFFKNVMVLNVL